MRNSTATSPRRRAGVAQPLDGGRDGLGLGDLVGVRRVGHGGGRRALGDQPDAARWGCRRAGRWPRRSTSGRGAVVADQVDRRWCRGALRELAQVGRVGAGERVDRLRRVADDADLVAAAEPEVEEGRLERRDVLELVDDEPLVLAAHLRGDPLVVGEHPGGQQQDVLHVHAGLGALDLLVAAEQPADGLGVDAVDGAAGAQRDLGVVVGADVADLGPLDLGRDVAQGRLVGADALAGGGGGEHAELGLGQRGQLGAVDVRPEVAQLAQGRGVEGARLDALDPEAAQPAAHLAGRSGGEGDREHLGGLVDARSRRRGRCGG